MLDSEINRIIVLGRSWPKSTSMQRGRVGGAGLEGGGDCFQPICRNIFGEIFSGK